MWSLLIKKDFTELSIKRLIRLLIAINVFILMFNSHADAATSNITNIGWANQNSPNTCYYGDTALNVGYFSGNYRKAIFMEMPVYGTGVTTTLYVYVNSWSGFQGQYYLQSYTSFSASTLTWNTKPTFIANFGGAIGFSNGWNNFIIYDTPQYVGLVAGGYENSASISSPFGSNPPYISFEEQTIIVSCPIGWCYVASNYTSKTLLELDNLFTTDTITGRYNSTSKKYESKRVGYAFNQNVSVTQKEGYYYYFTSAQDITITRGSTPSITLKPGWNLVGNYGSSSRTLSALKTSIGASATQAQYYNKTLKTWVSTDSQSVPAMETVMVYVTSQTAWSG